MKESSIEAMVRRLERVERENRRLKGVGAVAILGLAAGVLMGPATAGTDARVVEAEQFVLRDGEGKARAWLNVSEGSVNLALADKDEKSRALMYVLDDGTAGFALRDKESTRRAGLYVLADGSPALSLAGKEGRMRAKLAVLPSGSHGLILATKDGRTPLELKVGTNDLPDVSMRGSDGRRIGLFVQPDGRPVLGLVDETTKVRAKLGLEADGRVRLILSDKDATERAELAVLPDGTPRLSLTGHSGKMMWHGP